MPDRFLREALLNSERFNALSLDAQMFYVRLLLVVDDFGCFSANEMMVRNTTYRYGRSQPVLLDELHRAGLIVRYMNDGKLYLAITQWGERTRRKRRCPAPPVNTDLHDITYKGDERGHRAMDWRNPQRSDDVSVLLDADLRPVVPQPPEWRRVESDWMPIGSAVPQQVGGGPHTAKRERSERVGNATSLRSGYAATTQLEPMRPDEKVRSERVAPTQLPRTDHAIPVIPVVPDTSMPLSPTPQTDVPTQPLRTDYASPTTTTSPTGNGKLHLNGEGRWEGLSEAQRLRWQEMFPDLSIGDQVERAGAWLLANAAQRAAYEQQEGGLEAYLIRWLLREARPPTA